MNLKTHEITDRRTGKILYSGRFASLRLCVEQAVADGAALDHAHLEGANLINAALDGARLQGASFRGANLMGANLSEATLDDAIFSDACLIGTCLNRSSLRHCDFEGAAFGATDIQDCRIGGCTFSTPSAFSLNFSTTADMSQCTYRADSGRSCYFSRPPVVLGGLSRLIALLDDHMLAGADLSPLRTGTNDNLPAKNLDINQIELY